MEVTYISSVADHSGYGEAARNYIAALDKVGVNVSVIPVSFERDKSDLGKLGKLALSKVNVYKENDIQIIHLTPENYPRFIKKNKYNIAYTTWETNKLPDRWVPLINLCNEVWVPSKYNVKAFKDSGVTKPIFCIPHTFEKEYVFDETPTEVTSKGKDTFMFYSIFQWTERKGPIELLKAYLTEFKSNENVCLAIKTYLTDTKNTDQANTIKALIFEVKKKLYLQDYPKILLITKLLSRQQIQSLHNEGNCYISTHKSEGFGIPIAEAMMAGNPVIATDYSGSVDFVKNMKTGYSIDYQMAPVFGMPSPTYNGDMLWADPNILSARKHMRTVFENQEEAKKIGLAGQEWISSNLCWETIGNKMKDRLEEIKKGLKDG